MGWASPPPGQGVDEQVGQQGQQVGRHQGAHVGGLAQRRQQAGQRQEGSGDGQAVQGEEEGGALKDGPHGAARASGLRRQCVDGPAQPHERDLAAHGRQAGAQRGRRQLLRVSQLAHKGEAHCKA